MEEPGRLRLVLVGFGAVNRALLSILAAKGEALRARHGLEVLCVGASDSGGATANPSGLGLQELLDHKLGGASVDSFPAGSSCAGTDEMLTRLGDAGYDLLVDGSPVDLTTGGPGLAPVRRALAAGRSAVLANKAPLVVAFEELAQLAESGPPAPSFRGRPRLLYSATVCGGLPVLNVARRDLALTGASFSRVEGIFNSTTNYILSELQEGRSYDDALAEAQRLGIAEADPSLDVDGWDTANKLVIIANAVLGQPARLADVDVAGIRGVTPAMVMEARGRGEVYKLVATAEVPEGDTGGPPKLSVGPRALPQTSFLGGVQGWEMAVVFRTDLFEVVSLKIDEPTVTPTAAAVLRDVLHCAGL